MPSLPSSAPEAARWLFVAFSLTLIVVVGYYAINALAAVGFMIVLLVVGGLLLWIIAGRLWDAFRHGKPLIRGDWTDGDGGGD